MAVYNRPILIQKLDNETEIWSDYYSTHAEINKASGKEYFNASTNVSASTYNFTTRYCALLEDVQCNTSSCRVVYKNKVFDILNVDNKNLKNHELIIVGDFNNANS